MSVADTIAVTAQGSQADHEQGLEGKRETRCHARLCHAATYTSAWGITHAWRYLSILHT